MRLSTFLLLAACVAIALGQSCTSSSDCSSQGECVQGFCSCYSGFSGSNCFATPDNTCTYNSLSAMDQGFTFALTPSISGDIFTMVVQLPLEQTKFADASQGSASASVNSSLAYSLDTTIEPVGFPLCAYPSPSATNILWTKAAAVTGSCEDVYTFHANWTQAVAECGFTNNGTSGYWNQQFTITRRYLVPLGDSYVNRTQASTINVWMIFPTTVYISNSVVVSAPQSVSVSAVTNIAYNANADMWTLKIQTVTNRPYQLSAPSITNTGEIQTDNRASNYSISNLSACNNNNDNCAQVITLQFTGCQALSGLVYVALTPVCNNGTGTTCPAISGNVYINNTIATGSSCPVTSTISFTQQSLTSYASSALTTAKSAFRASDIAYFAVDIMSADATIVSRNVSNVCMIFGNSTCQPVDFTYIPTPGPLKNPAFSVNLAATEQMAGGDLSSSPSFTVTAQITLQWLGGNKRTVEVRMSPMEARANAMSRSMNSNIRVEAPLLGESEQVSSAASFSAVAVAVLAMICLLF